jgi:hypothetical protein
MGIIVYSQLLQANGKTRCRQAATCGKTVYRLHEWGALFANPSRYRERGRRGQLGSACKLFWHYTDEP